MSTLMLVRHGQASLFSDDYDRLSDLGLNQAEALGQFWLERKIRPDSVCSGTLNRQRQTALPLNRSGCRANAMWHGIYSSTGYPASWRPGERANEDIRPSL